MNKTIYSACILGMLALPVSAATVWIGNANGGDGGSFFQEANWDTDGDVNAPYTTPSAGSIDPATALAVDSYFVTASTITNIGTLTFGNVATSLTLDAASITTFAAGLNGAGTLNLNNGSSFGMQFINSGLTVAIDGTSSLTLWGGNDPLPGAAIDLAVGGVLNFTNENVADATSEHLGSITIGGAAVNLGVNATLVSDGGTGSILTAVAVPEPSSAALLGLGGIALILRRRK